MDTGRLFYIAAVLCLFSVFQVTFGQDEKDRCKGVVCPRGRMCMSHMDSGETYTTCECPTSCPAESAPVCSFYHRQFDSPCEMHKFSCAHDLTMKIMNQGDCPLENRHVCSDKQLLQFPIRYLEWIMLARDFSLNPNFTFDLGDRADGLIGDERTEVLSWEFEYIDQNRNDLLDDEEIQDVFDDVLDYEPCLYGFLESCDLNGKKGIDKREWDFCFPKTGTAFETRK